MIKKICLILLLVVSFFILIETDDVVARNDVRIVGLEGVVQRGVENVFGLEGWQNIYTGDDIGAGTRVRTRDNSFLELAFDNNIYLLLSPETELIIGKGENEPCIEVEKGRIWSGVDLDFEVVIPGMTVDVKDSVFSLRVDEDGTVMSILSGQVGILVNDTAEKFNLEKGEMVYFRNGRVDLLDIIKQSERQKWLQEDIKVWVEKVVGNSDELFSIFLEQKELELDKSDKDIRDSE